jgi:hypothetical protein
MIPNSGIIFNRDETNPKEVDIHLLPIKIAHNGKANVSQYFKYKEDNQQKFNGIFFFHVVILNFPHFT